MEYAQYEKNHLYEDNMFIQALPPMLEERQLIEKLSYYPVCTEEMRAYPKKERLRLLPQVYQVYLLGIQLQEEPKGSSFLLSLPAVEYLSKVGTLDFTAPVTFFVGENGTGKSTLLEAIAAAAGLNPEGGSRASDSFLPAIASI